MGLGFYICIGAENLKMNVDFIKVNYVDYKTIFLVSTLIRTFVQKRTDGANKTKTKVKTSLTEVSNGKKRYVQLPYNSRLLPWIENSLEQRYVELHDEPLGQSLHSYRGE